MKISNWFLPMAMVATVAIACQSTSEAEPASAPAAPVAEEPLMYEASELAALMRRMEEENKEMRSQILEGNYPDSYPEDYANIHTAEATNPRDINETFHSLAQLYLENMDAIVEAEGEAVIPAFNTMVSTCISCHQLYCQGPIPRIRKLRIPQQDGA